MRYYTVFMRPVNGNTATEDMAIPLRADNKNKAHQIASEHVRPASLLDPVQWHVRHVQAGW